MLQRHNDARATKLVLDTRMERQESARRNDTTNPSKMSNPIGPQQSDLFSHPPPTFANKDGQHRATPFSMPHQPAFSTVTNLLLA